MKSPRQSHEPIAIKSRGSCLSPSRNGVGNGDTNRRSLMKGEEKTQRIYIEQETLVNSPGRKENVVLREVNRNSAAVYQTVIRNRSPPRIEMEKQVAALPVKYTEPLATIPVRELQLLQQRCQASEVKLHEATLARATLEMEKKQFSEAYQQLKVSSEQEKRQLTRLYEELKGAHETLNRQHCSIKLENEMLGSRLVDRSNKLEELLQGLRERSTGGSGITERRSDGFSQVKESSLWKQKYQQLCAKIISTVKVPGTNETDAENLLDNFGRWVGDLISIHNTQKSILREEVVKLREQVHSPNQTTCEQESHEITGSNLQISIARRCVEGTTEKCKPAPVQTVPLTEQRDLLIQWKWNIEEYYKVTAELTQKQLQQLQQSLPNRELCECSQSRSNLSECKESIGMQELQQLSGSSQLLKY